MSLVQVDQGERLTSSTDRPATPGGRLLEALCSWSTAVGVAPMEERVLVVDVTDDASISRGWAASVSLCITRPFGPAEVLVAVKRVLSCARDSSGRKDHASR